MAGVNNLGNLTALSIDAGGNLLVSATALPLPSGAATEATLAAMSAKLPATLGQKAMAASMAVVVASDQTALHVIVDSSALPSGASTSTKQDTGNTSLASIDTKTPALGQAAMAASVPVAIASNQSTLPVSAASLPLPSGAATSAKQDTGNTSLASIDTKLTAPLAVQAPSVDGSSYTDNPLALAGKSSNGAGVFLKQALTSVFAAVDGDGNDVIALAVKDYSQGSAADVSATLTAGAPTANLSGSGTNSIIVEISGTWTGSIACNSVSTVTTPMQMRQLGTTTVVSAITANGAYVVYGGSLENVQFVGTGLTGSANLFAYTQFSDPDVYAHISGVVPLPTGAATETTLAAASAKLPATLGQKAMAASMAVVVASDQSALPVAASNGMAKANAPAYNDYTSTSVTTGAYVQLIASTSAAAKVIEVFDSSGQAMILAVGGAGSEVDQFFIFPGGQGQVPLAIPAGSRVSIKAKTATASSGYIAVNLYG